MKTIVFAVVLAFGGCVSSVPQKVFQPSGEQVEWYFVNGLPFGMSEDAKTLLMFTLESATLSGKTYLRLWVLCQNKTDKSFLLDPGNSFTIKPSFYPESKPESATKILSSIDNQQATALILQAVGGALEAMGTKPTTVTSSSGQTLTVNDQKEKQRFIQEKNAGELARAQEYYTAFRESISSGILRRNTLFPRQSVNGYVYFELPRTSGQSYQIRPEQHDFDLKIELPNGSKWIRFKPIEGE